jgi:hypothetical protein
MKKQIIIGDKTFKYKKDALGYFKAILNAYGYGEILNENDKSDVLELLKLHPNFEEKNKSGIQGFKVDKVRFNTKCFHIIKSDSTLSAFSYTKCINGNQSFTTKFSRTCREIIQGDLRNVKQKYFSDNSVKGQVKCQETSELCLWEELVVDHRQPNTFSIIVDRFIEVNRIDILKVEYVEKIDAVYEFKEFELAEKFRQYHKQKANLRIVKKGKNSGRAHQARVKRQKKDLKIE